MADARQQLELEQAYEIGCKAGDAASDRDQPRVTFQREYFRKWARLQTLPFADLDKAYADGYRHGYGERWPRY